MSRCRFFSAVGLAFLLCLAPVCLAQPSPKAGSSGGGSGAGGGKGSGSSQSSGSGQSSQGATSFFESQMLAYGALNQLSYAISRQVCEKLPDQATIVLFDQTSFQNLQAWQAFVTTGSLLQESYGTLMPQAEYDKLIPPPKKKTPSGNITLFSFFAGSDVSGMITALAASTTNTPSQFTIPDSALAISIAHQLTRSCVDSKKAAKTFKLKYYPLFGSSANLDDAKDAASDVLAGPNKLRRYLQTTKGALPTGTSANNDPKYLLFADMNTLYDQLVTTLITSISQNQTPTQGGTTTPGASGVTSILQGADLEKTLSQDNTYILYGDVLAAGGTQRDRKNIFSVLIFGDFITYSGGVVVNFGVVKSSDNSPVLADTLRYRTTNTRLASPSKGEFVENTNSGDNIDSLCNQEARHHLGDGTKALPADCMVRSPPGTTQ
jgi:hypothetical protein